MAKKMNESKTNNSAARNKIKVFILLIFSTILIVGGYLVKGNSYDLPGTEKIKFQDLKKKLSKSSKIKRRFFDRNGKLLWIYPSSKNNKYVSLENISPHFKKYVLTFEDDKFYSHTGIDWKELKSALILNIKKGEVRRGASTISQQVVKNLILDSKRTIVRKLYEIPWTKKLETSLSKNQILELYLNLLPLGNGTVGISSAAYFYFNKKPIELNEIESLYLTMLIPSPGRYNLIENPKYLPKILKRKDLYIQRLRNEKKISKEIYDLLKESKFNFEGNSQISNVLKTILIKIHRKSPKDLKDIKLSIDKDILTNIYSLSKVEEVNNELYVLKKQNEILAISSKDLSDFILQDSEYSMELNHPNYFNANMLLK